MSACEGRGSEEASLLPGPWNTLTLEQMERALRQYGALVARQLLGTGVRVNYRDLGNEVDWGVAGSRMHAQQRCQVVRREGDLGCIAMAGRLQVAPGTLARPSGRCGRGPVLVSAPAFSHPPGCRGFARVADVPSRAQRGAVTHIRLNTSST